MLPKVQGESRPFEGEQAVPVFTVWVQQNLSQTLIQSMEQILKRIL